MVQLRSWMIPAEACPGTFVALKGPVEKQQQQQVQTRLNNFWQF
jgi:hypothetical protein